MICRGECHICARWWAGDSDALPSGTGDWQRVQE